MSLLDSLLGAFDVVFGGSTLTRRKKLEFTGSLTVTDDPVQQRTLFNIQGGTPALTVVDYTANATVAVGTWGRFEAASGTLTATLANGTSAGQRVGVLWVVDSTDNVSIAMGNVEGTHGGALSLGSNGVRGISFIWQRNGEGPYRWWIESTINYPIA